LHASRERGSETDERQLFTANRRSFISTGSSATITAVVASLIPGCTPAYADVSDGNVLPPGAKEFSNVIQLKSDIVNIRKRVAENADEMDTQEWGKLSQYMRTVYSAGNDMKVVSKSMYDPEKKKRADELVKIVQKAAQAGEIPIAQKNASGFVTIAEKITASLEEFFDLLSDVPDEI